MQQHKSSINLKLFVIFFGEKKKKFKVKPPSCVAKGFGLFCDTSTELRGLGIMALFAKGHLMYYL